MQVKDGGILIMKTAGDEEEEEYETIAPLYVQPFRRSTTHTPYPLIFLLHNFTINLFFNFQFYHFFLLIILHVLFKYRPAFMPYKQHHSVCIVPNH